MALKRDLVKLRQSYDKTAGKAEAFRAGLADEIRRLLEQHSLNLAVSIESRIKKWESLLIKLDRLGASWADVREIWDLVGLRLVFLFPEESEKACSILDQTFKVVDHRNVGQDRSDDTFGYSSVHITIHLRSAWLTLPSFKDWSGFPVEIQIRTLSQHNWAVASRILQYDNESFAPPSVRRSFFRVAALLELVDLELDRVQKQRVAYRKDVSQSKSEQILNVDLLDAMLKRHLPKEHRMPKENYASLLSDLNRCGILNNKNLIELIDQHLRQALANNQTAVNKVRSGDATYDADESQVAKGVFYSHVGLIKNMLNMKFGRDWRKTQKRRKFYRKRLLTK